MNLRIEDQLEDELRRPRLVNNAERADGEPSISLRAVRCTPLLSDLKAYRPDFDAGAEPKLT